jgi:hypothetical protein
VMANEVEISLGSQVEELAKHVIRVEEVCK